MKPEPKKPPAEVRAETLKRLQDFNNSADDWRSVCRTCGADRTGTLADLKRPCKACADGT